jgi:hypothetical protein
MTDTLVPMTVRLEPAVSEALTKAARKDGQEVADYAADVLTTSILNTRNGVDSAVRKRLQAELELKAKAISAARRFTLNAFDPDVTLRVFQHVKEVDELRRLYERAIGDRPGHDRGNHIKARINRTLGAAIKTAVSARPKTTAGKAVKGQVSGEFIFSYTVLERAPGRRTD